MHARLYDEAWFGSVGLLAQFEVDLLIGVEREGGDKTTESSLIAPRPPYDIRIMAIKPAVCGGPPPHRFWGGRVLRSGPTLMKPRFLEV